MSGLLFFEIDAGVDGLRYKPSRNRQKEAGPNMEPASLIMRGFYSPPL